MELCCRAYLDMGVDYDIAYVGYIVELELYHVY